MDTWPLDVLLHVLGYLPIQTVLALRSTSKTLFQLTHLRSLWVLLFRQYVLEQHLPHPNICIDDLDADDLDADDLESLVHRALALRRNWSSPEPIPRRQRTLDITECNARIIFLQFLPGRSNRWLISVRMTARPRTYRLQCWDLAGDQPRCAAELIHADGPYGGVVLNSDPHSPAVLALQSAQTETLSINFDANDPESAFETEATIDGIRELHLLSGSTLVTRRIDDHRALSLWHLSDLSQETLLLLNPSLIQPDDRIQAIHLAHDYALVVRIQFLELYSTTPRPNIIPVPGAPIAYPLAQFKFQWRTDAVVLCEQHAAFPTTRPRSIHLLVRFGNIFPWPINLLHHMVVRPNPAYRPPKTTENNLPYDFPPALTQTFTSPIRLFAQSPMIFGRYGTALWLDSDVEETSDQSQRLAGSILAADSTTDASPETTNASMVFGLRDNDPWTRIAMDEETGRIAIGHVDGAVTLLEY